MFTATDVLAALLLPFAFAYGGYWLARSHGRSPDVGALAALGLALVMGQLALESRGDWIGPLDTYLSWLSRGVVAGAGNIKALISPKVARNWIPWFVLAAVISGVLKKCQLRWTAVLASLAIAVLLPIRLLWSSVYLQPWSWASVIWLVTIGLAVFAVGQLRSQTRADDRTLCGWLTCCTAAAASVTLAMSGSITYGQLGGALTSALSGILVAAVVFRDSTDWSLAEGPIDVVMGGLLILGVFFAEVTVVHTVLLTLALLLSRPIFALSPAAAVRRWIAVALVGVLLTFVVVQAGMRFSRSLTSGSAIQHSDGNPAGRVRQLTVNVHGILRLARKPKGEAQVFGVTGTGGFRIYMRKN